MQRTQKWSPPPCAPSSPNPTRSPRGHICGRSPTPSRRGPPRSPSCCSRQRSTSPPTPTSHGASPQDRQHQPAGTGPQGDQAPVQRRGDLYRRRGHQAGRRGVARGPRRLADQRPPLPVRRLHAPDRPGGTQRYARTARRMACRHHVEAHTLTSTTQRDTALPVGDSVVVTQRSRPTGPGFSAEELVHTPDGVPVKSLNPRSTWVPVAAPAGGGESMDLLVEAAADPIITVPVADLGDLSTSPDRRRPRHVSLRIGRDLAADAEPRGAPRRPPRVAGLRRPEVGDEGVANGTVRPGRPNARRRAAPRPGAPQGGSAPAASAPRGPLRPGGDRARRVPLVDPLAPGSVRASPAPPTNDRRPDGRGNGRYCSSIAVMTPSVTSSQ